MFAPLLCCLIGVGGVGMYVTGGVSEILTGFGLNVRVELDQRFERVVRGEEAWRTSRREGRGDDGIC